MRMASTTRAPAVEFAFLVVVLASVFSASRCNGQNTTGTYVDVTQTVTSQVADRFGTQPSARSGQTMVRVDANIAILFGGLTSAGVTNDVWEYKHDTGNWTRLHEGGATPADSPVATVPPPRVGHAAVALQGDLWRHVRREPCARVFGGYDTIDGDRNDVWHFSRSGGTWRQVVTPATDATPSVRSGHSAVALDPAGTSFVVFGGNLRNDAWEFDTSTEKWRMIMSQLATSAAGHGVTRGAGAAVAAALAAACAAALAVL